MALLVCVVVSWIAAAAVVGRAVHFWRHSAGQLPDPSPGAAFVSIATASVRRGAFRAFVPKAIGIVGIALMFTTSMLTTELSGAWFVGVFGAGMLMLLVGYVLFFLVVWFNRPKFLLPSYLRAERGVLTVKFEKWVRRFR
jgi:hypothetical protein